MLVADPVCAGVHPCIPVIVHRVRLSARLRLVDRHACRAILLPIFRLLQTGLPQKGQCQSKYGFLLVTLLCYYHYLFSIYQSHHGCLIHYYCSCGCFDVCLFLFAFLQSLSTDSYYCYCISQ